MLEEVILAPQALKRLLEPAEVADAVAFLLGPGGRRVHGRAARDGQRLDRPLGVALGLRSAYGILTVRWFDRAHRTTGGARMKARVLLAALAAPARRCDLLVSTALAGPARSARRDMAKLRGVNFVSRVHVQPRAPDDPIVFFGQAGRLARPLVRREHGDERVVDARVAPRERHDVPSPRRHRGVLDADALRERPGGDPEPRADLLPPEDDAPRRGFPARVPHGRRRRQGDGRAAAPRDVLELRRRCRHRADEHRADLP